MVEPDHGRASLRVNQMGPNGDWSADEVPASGSAVAQAPAWRRSINVAWL